MSKPDQLAAQQRAAILARDTALADQIDSAYGQMWRSLVHKLFKLLDDMQKAEQEAKAAGMSFNAILWVHQIRRLDTLLSSVQQGMDTFQATARSLILTQAQPIWALGERDALTQLREALPGINIEFGRPSLQAFENLAQRNYLFAGMENDAIIAVRKRLLAGLALGQGPREVAASIQQGIKNVTRNRALVVAREELINPYRDANLAIFRQNADVVRGWRWLTAEDERVCPECGPMDGQEFPLSASFQAPHLCCRCCPSPLTYGYDEILARYAA